MEHDWSTLIHNTVNVPTLRDEVNGVLSQREVIVLVKRLLSSIEGRTKPVGKQYRHLTRNKHTAGYRLLFVVFLVIVALDVARQKFSQKLSNMSPSTYLC